MIKIDGFEDINRREFAKILKDNDLQLLAINTSKDCVNKTYTTTKFYGKVEELFDKITDAKKTKRVSKDYYFSSVETVYLKVVKRIQLHPTSGIWYFWNFYTNINKGVKE